jgi:hypothetical protein
MTNCFSEYSQSRLSLIPSLAEEDTTISVSCHIRSNETAVFTPGNEEKQEKRSNKQLFFF